MARILLATGIYPPQIGGPAQYAFNLAQEFKNLGHKVHVAKFSAMRIWPSGLRHFFFFLQLLPQIWHSDCCVILDTFSVAVPAVAAARLLGKKTVIRAGGDFLWESYVERTGDLVTLPEFYTPTIRSRWSGKDRFIFRLVSWTLRHSNAIAFNSTWLAEIWRGPYRLAHVTTTIIDNFYPAPEVSFKLPVRKNFLFTGRHLKLKNEKMLDRAVDRAQQLRPEIKLEKIYTTPESWRAALAQSYALIIPSLSEVNPNLVSEAVTFGKPCLLTQFNGLNETIKSLVIPFDPRSEQELAEKISWLADDQNYAACITKLQQNRFSHPWSDIAQEFLNLIHRV